MVAYRRFYDSRHLQADCQEPGSTPEPYARHLSIGYLYLLLYMYKSISEDGRLLVGSSTNYSQSRLTIFHTNSTSPIIYVCTLVLRRPTRKKIITRPPSRYILWFCCSLFCLHNNSFGKRIHCSSLDGYYYYYF